MSARVSSGSVGTGCPSTAVTGTARRTEDVNHTASARSRSRGYRGRCSAAQPWARAVSKIRAWEVPGRIPRDGSGVTRVGGTPGAVRAQITEDVAPSRMRWSEDVMNTASCAPFSRAWRTAAMFTA